MSLAYYSSLQFWKISNSFQCIAVDILSKIFLHILKEVDPELESMGMDEANLDITDVVSGKTS